MLPPSEVLPDFVISKGSPLEDVGVEELQQWDTFSSHFFSGVQTSARAKTVRAQRKAAAKAKGKGRTRKPAATPATQPRLAAFKVLEGIDAQLFRVLGQGLSHFTPTAEDSQRLPHLRPTLSLVCDEGSVGLAGFWFLLFHVG